VKEFMENGQFLTRKLAEHYETRLLTLITQKLEHRLHSTIFRFATRCHDYWL